MSTIRRLWVPVLVAALVAMLIGPSGVTAAEPRPVWGTIMVPAAAFTPATGGGGYDNSGFYLRMFSGGTNFIAPLTFPVPVVKVRKLTLYAWDNSSAGVVCAFLGRAKPPTASVVYGQGDLCTSDSAEGPQVLSTTAISPRLVNTAVHGPFLSVYIEAPGLKLYGVAVTYTYET